MKVMMMLFAGLLSFSIARTASADPCSGNFCNNTGIAKLNPNGDPSIAKVYVQPADGGQASLSCTPVSGIYLSLKPTNAFFSEIYATLLQATMANKKVTFRIYQGSADCEIAYVVISNP